MQGVPWRASWSARWSLLQRVRRHGRGRCLAVDVCEQWDPDLRSRRSPRCHFWHQITRTKAPAIKARDAESERVCSARQQPCLRLRLPLSLPPYINFVADDAADMSRLVSKLSIGSRGVGLTRTNTGGRGWLIARSCASGIRTIHNRLELPYKIEEGMGDFLTPEGLKMIAVDYQQGLLDRLNDEVRGKHTPK